MAAVAAAAPGDTILLAPGTYSLANTLVITTPGVTLRSATDNAADVVLDGRNVLDPAVYVRASDVKVLFVTITAAGVNGMIVEANTQPISGVSIYGVRFIDNRGTALRVRPSGSRASGPFADSGAIECSRFEITPAGNCQDSVFGVRVAGARNWLVRSNDFHGERCSAARVARCG